MANLIQATVYQIDGSPLPSPITLDFQTSQILIKEVVINIAAVNSAIQVYNNPNNSLGYKTYYVSETVSTLSVAGLCQATVLDVNGDPQLPGGFQYSFPSREIIISSTINPTTGVNATIAFKGVNYGVSETQATLFANANMGTGTVTGSGASGQVSFWNGPSSLTGSNNLFWDAANGRLGVGTNVPPSKLSIVNGDISVNTSGQPYSISTRYGANSDGLNIWIGNGGLSSVGVIGQTFRGSNNTSLGHSALFAATTGYQNTAIGSGSLIQSTTGICNTGLGANSLQTVVSGGFNTAVGFNALSSNTASNNTAVGASALASNTSGSSNTAVGLNALTSNTNGTSNTAVGQGALNSNTAFGNNTAVGSGALQSVNGGTTNTAIGSTAGTNVSSGSGNVFIGSNAAAQTVSSGNFTTSNSCIYIGSATIASGNGVTDEIVIGNGTIGRGTNTVTIGVTGTTSSLLRGELRIGTLNNLGSAAANFLTYNGTNDVKTRTAAEVRSDIGLSNAITGTGTTNYHLKFTGSTTVANSLINDNGVQIGYNAVATASYAHNFGSVGLITNFETGTNGRIRIASSFATDADGFVLAPFGNFIFGSNIYYNQPNWIYDKNGYGVYIQMEATTGTISFIRAPQNVSGPGVLATPAGSGTFWNTGNFSVNKSADFGWKVDIGATTDGLRVTGSGTTSATTGLKVETSGAITNFVVLDNGNCGVRVASPTARMHVVTGGATTASIGLRVRNSADTVDIIGSYGTTQVVINSTSGALSTSAQFQIDSTTRGFLPPRMTGAQAEAISGPAAGLLVYSTDGSGAVITSLGWWGYDGTTWVKLN
jgi:hypothetical protein